MPAIGLFEDAQLYARAPIKGSPEYLAENNIVRILTPMGAMGFVAVVTTILRLYVRKFMLHGLRSDDVVMAVAMAVGVVLFACFCVQSKYGLGRHAEAITPQMRTNYQKGQMGASVTLVSAMCLVKISISLLLIKLVNNKNLIRFLWCFIGLLVAYAIASDLTIILACIPVDAYWNLAKQKTAKCFSVQTYSDIGVSNSVITIVTDVTLAVLPMPIVWNLHTTRRNKVALSGILALGLVAVAAGGTKVHYQLKFLTDYDRLFTYYYHIWATVELYLAIIAANLPTLRPLMASFFHSIKTTIVTSGNRSGQNGGRSASAQWRLRPSRSKSQTSSGRMGIQAIGPNSSQEGLVINDKRGPMGVTPMAKPTIVNSDNPNDLAMPREDIIIRTTHISTSEAERNEDDSPYRFNGNSFPLRRL